MAMAHSSVAVGAKAVTLRMKLTLSVGSLPAVNSLSSVKTLEGCEVREPVFGRLKPVQPKVPRPPSQLFSPPSTSENTPFNIDTIFEKVVISASGATRDASDTAPGGE